MEPSKKIGPGCKEHMDRVTWKRETQKWLAGLLKDKPRCHHCSMYLEWDSINKQFFCPNCDMNPELHDGDGDVDIGN